jgi:hypothetical protein
VEISSIDATPAWCTERGSSSENPEIYQVAMYRQGWEQDRESDIMGEYLLDGTIETYEKAKENFGIVCYKLLTRGWCTAEDFENFEFY